MTRPAPRGRGRLAAAAAASVVAIAAAGCGSAHASPRRPGSFPPARLAPCRPGPVPCWGQDPLHRAYDTGPLYARGITGRGTTIAVIIPGAGPWVLPWLARFSRQWRLPPATVQFPSGGGLPAPAAYPGPYWAQEGAADLEVLHYMAPGARLLFLPAPGATTVAAAQAASAELGVLSARERVDVASFSWGAYESDILRAGGPRLAAAMSSGIAVAAGRGTTVIAGSGDSGAGEPGSPARTVPWPTSDPLVTGTGIISLAVTASGAVRGGLAVPSGGPRPGPASGGGLSAIYPRPAWQDRDAAVTGSRRGVPDVALTGVFPQVVIPPGLGVPPGGRFPLIGTSASAPVLAGITALACQEAGRPLGPLNPLLYAAAARGPASGITDVTRGSDAVPGDLGYAAGPGYDLASGTGAVTDAAALAAVLARAAKAS